MFGFRITSALLLACSLHAVAGGAAGGGAGVSAISLERDCNGCTSGSRLTLQASGRAQLVTLGKARLGTADTLREGRLAPGAFAVLAQLVATSGVAVLDDDVSDPNLQDGPWLLLRIEWTDGRTKQVFHRGETRSPALAAVVEAVDGAAAQIAFDPPT